jgi:predicted transcriptional regulator
MITKPLDEVLKRATSWPEDVQQELAEVALQVDRSLVPKTYQATEGELEGIDRGIADADAGRFGSAEAVEALLHKSRSA